MHGKNQYGSILDKQNELAYYHQYETKPVVVARNKLELLLTHLYMPELSMMLQMLGQCMRI